jgi:hypothetical protein
MTLSFQTTPFVSSEVETPAQRASTSLDTNEAKFALILRRGFVLDGRE